MEKRRSIGVKMEIRLYSGSIYTYVIWHPPMSATMNRRFAFWVAFLSAFLASALALLVAFKLGLAHQLGRLSLGSELSGQSRWAAVAALAALVSAIAQIIERASR